MGLEEHIGACSIAFVRVESRRCLIPSRSFKSSFTHISRTISASSYMHAGATNLTMIRGTRRNSMIVVKKYFPQRVRRKLQVTERDGHRKEHCGPKEHIAE